MPRTATWTDFRRTAREELDKHVETEEVVSGHKKKRADDAIALVATRPLATVPWKDMTLQQQDAKKKRDATSDCGQWVRRKGECKFGDNCRYKHDKKFCQPPTDKLEASKGKANTAIGKEKASIRQVKVEVDRGEAEAKSESDEEDSVATGPAGKRIKFAK